MTIDTDHLGLMATVDCRPYQHGTPREVPKTMELEEWADLMVSCEWPDIPMRDVLRRHGLTRRNKRQTELDLMARIMAVLELAPELDTRQHHINH